jgi:hypothetical protein
MIAASAATLALVGAAPASAQGDSFTFGDADVIGPVHVRGTLKSGWAWVQFCVTTDEGLSAVRMEWSRVVTNR